MYQNLAILAAFVFFYGIFGHRLAISPVNGAVVFTVFGLIMGPLGLDLLHLNVGTEGLQLLAELTLALVLFSDAANANLRELRHSYRIPMRLLLIGLPLTIALGIAAGFLLFSGLSFLEIAILATMLAPTDAALGKAVVTAQSVPANIREALNVESGLNDGICVPVLFIFLALITSAGGETSTPLLALRLVTESIGIGIAVGAGLTWICVRLIEAVARRGWVAGNWGQLPIPALAVSCFAMAQMLGGSGFIACFVGGILFGRLEQEHKQALLLRAEDTGSTMALITWVVFGAGVIGQHDVLFHWDAALYAVLSLTVIRMVPVLLALTGTTLRLNEKLFIGWFGPRGLASVVFAVIVLHDNIAANDVIITTVIYTISLSIIAHGLSANPLVARLSAKINTGEVRP